MLLRNSSNLMTMKKLTTLAAVMIALATFVTSSHALTARQAQDIKTTVLSVPVPEMPAKAAELVINAEKQDRQAVAVTAVRAIVMKHRAAAPVVIAAVSKAAPDLAPVVALAAAEIAPEQKDYIVRAASLAAPAQATKIASTVSVRTTALIQGRGNAAEEPDTGDPTISPNRINGESFPDTEPEVGPEPVVIYSQPAP